MYPSEIAIGHYDWDIEFTDNLREGVWGDCEHRKCVIRIDENLSNIHTATTVLHEVIHAALANCGIMEHDELFVSAASIRLVEIMRDNPKLVKALMNDEG